MSDALSIDFRTITFPATSRSRYVTGIAALNIPAPENTGGDWHFLNTFKSRSFPGNIDLAGEELEWNTNALFGDYGIHECSDYLRSRGVPIEEGIPVYSANHYRAILDMVYRSVSVGRIPWHIDIDDWLDSEQHRTMFFFLLDRFSSKFSPAEQKLTSCWVDAIS